MHFQGLFVKMICMRR